MSEHVFLARLGQQVALTQLDTPRMSHWYATVSIDTSKQLPEHTYLGIGSPSGISVDRTVAEYTFVAQFICPEGRLRKNQHNWWFYRSQLT